MLFLLALAAASAALARPRASVTAPAQRATLVLLVDVSGSMRAADVKPSRLGAAQQAMSTFADNVPKQVKVGLVSFSTSPNVLVIPTADRGVLHEGIDLLAPEAGTAIGDGLGVAVQVARSSLGSAERGRDGKVPAAIVLLSDGAQTRGLLTPAQGAERAKQAGIRVYTIALGTNHGTLGIGPFGGYGTNGGRRFPVRPDPVTLAMIARVTDGKAIGRSRPRASSRSTGSSARASPAPLDPGGLLLVRRRGRAAPARLAGGGGADRRAPALARARGPTSGPNVTVPSFSWQILPEGHTSR